MKCDNTAKKIYYVPKDVDAVVEKEIQARVHDKNGDLHFIVHSDKPELDFEAVKMCEHIYFNREEAEKHLKEVVK